MTTECVVLHHPDAKGAIALLSCPACHQRSPAPRATQKRHHQSPSSRLPCESPELTGLQQTWFAGWPPAGLLLHSPGATACVSTRVRSVSFYKKRPSRPLGCWPRPANSAVHMLCDKVLAYHGVLCLVFPTHDNPDSKSTFSLLDGWRGLPPCHQTHKDGIPRIPRRLEWVIAAAQPLGVCDCGCWAAGSVDVRSALSTCPDRHVW